MASNLLFSPEHVSQLSYTEIMRCGHYTSRSAMFSLLHINKTEGHYKKDFCNQSSHERKLRQLPLQTEKPSHELQ